MLFKLIKMFYSTVHGLLLVLKVTQIYLVIRTYLL